MRHWAITDEYVTNSEKHNVECFSLVNLQRTVPWNEPESFMRNNWTAGRSSCKRQAKEHLQLIVFKVCLCNCLTEAHSTHPPPINTAPLFPSPSDVQHSACECCSVPWVLFDSVAWLPSSITTERMFLQARGTNPCSLFPDDLQETWKSVESRARRELQAGGRSGGGPLTTTAWSMLSEAQTFFLPCLTVSHHVPN